MNILRICCSAIQCRQCSSSSIVHLYIIHLFSCLLYYSSLCYSIDIAFFIGHTAKIAFRCDWYSCCSSLYIIHTLYCDRINSDIDSVTLVYIISIPCLTAALSAAAAFAVCSLSAAAAALLLYFLSNDQFTPLLTTYTDHTVTLCSSITLR